MKRIIKVFGAILVGALISTIPVMAAEDDEIICSVSITGRTNWLDKTSLSISPNASYIIYGKGQEKTTAIDALIEGVYYAVFATDPTEADLEIKKNILQVMLGSTSYETGVVDGLMGEYNGDNYIWKYGEGTTVAGISALEYTVSNGAELWFERDLLEVESTTESKVNTETSKTKIAKPTISKLSKYKKRKVKINISKVSGVTGYQVKYSLSKRFKDATVIASKKRKFKTKKLSSGKYYFKGRAYMKINGIKYYSKWSTVQTITIK